MGAPTKSAATVKLVSLTLKADGFNNAGVSPLMMRCPRSPP